MMAIRIEYLLAAGLWLAFTSTAQAQGPQPSASIDSLYQKAKLAQQQGNTKEAIAAYEAILQRAPSLAPAYNNLGSLYYDDGQFDHAVSILKRGLHLDPKMAASYAVLGSAYLALGNKPQALTALKEAVRLNPKDQRSEDLLEQTMASAGDYPALEERLHARTLADPHDQDAWARLGRVYLQLSEQALTRARSIDPNSAVAYELQGEALEATGNLEGAKEQYRSAIRVAPDQPGTHEHLGNLLWVQGDFDAARAEFEQELQNDPSSCRAHWKIGNTLVDHPEQAEKALSELNQAIQRCPELMQAHVDRAKVLVQTGHAPEALPDLLLAQKQNPDEPSIHFWLSRVYRAQGRSAETAAELKRFDELTEKNKQTPSPPPSPNNP